MVETHRDEAGSPCRPAFTVWRADGQELFALLEREAARLLAGEITRIEAVSV